MVYIITSCKTARASRPTDNLSSGQTLIQVLNKKAKPPFLARLALLDTPRRVQTWAGQVKVFGEEPEGIEALLFDFDGTLVPYANWDFFREFYELGTRFLNSRQKRAFLEAMRKLQELHMGPYSRVIRSADFQQWLNCSRDFFSHGREGAGLAFSLLSSRFADNVAIVHYIGYPWELAEYLWTTFNEKIALPSLRLNGLLSSFFEANSNLLVAIVSSNFQGYIEMSLDKLGIRKYVDVIVGYAEKYRGPHGYLEALRLLGVPADRALIIGDGPHDDVKNGIETGALTAQLGGYPIIPYVPDVLAPNINSLLAYLNGLFSEKK